MEDEIRLALDPLTQRVTVEDPSPTVSVLWDRAVQEAVIANPQGPTVASRAYAITHTAIYDAWAAFDPQAQMVSGLDSLDAVAGEATEAALAEAMSFAAFTALSALYPGEGALFAAVMRDLGLDPESFLPESPAAVGIQIGEALIAARLEDGANQAGGYADTSGYQPLNVSPLAILDIARWTPENVPIDAADAQPEQSFLTPHWGGVTPFALASADALRPPAPEPFFLPGVDATLDLEAGLIVFGGETPPAPAEVTKELIGSIINPAFVEQAGAVVAFSGALTDEQKLIAEFWEDAGRTGFPPGTWMTFGQYVSARDDHTAGQDAVMFLALGNAVMDAGIATWEAKTFYDYARPVRTVRELGTLGLIGEPGVDALTGESGFVIDAWAGPGLGTQTVLAENFLTYQTPGGDPSPPFAEHTSGHSSFSAAAAEVLLAFTGSEAFGASVLFAPGSSRFEPGSTPAQAVTLAWDSFAEAADEAGLSRLYGGIHFANGDLNGRALGREVGRDVWAETLLLITGAAGEAPDAPQAPAQVLSLARFFEAALDRPANLPGLDFWADALERGVPLERIADAFLGSAEFARYSGPAGALEDAGFVALLLANLGLAEDGALADALTAELGGGASRASVLADLAGSEEAAAATPYLNALVEIDDGWGYA